MVKIEIVQKNAHVWHSGAKGQYDYNEVESKY